MAAQGLPTPGADSQPSSVNVSEGACFVDIMRNALGSSLYLFSVRNRQ